MEAPEKIYLQEPTKVRTEKKYDNDVEYTRTDAFIEKASKWITENYHEYDHRDEFDVKGLVLDFKEYMKG